ncbi:MAG TPA: Smr/MutS family protein, partial [Acidobacteriota bacterium]|nr:Smr/MutS family protein [Acidobacteriota bacterium]
DLVRLQELEELEISKILLFLSDAIRRNLDAIMNLVRIMTALDIAQAKALFAAEFNCSCPKVSHDKRCRIEDARHVLLEQSLRKTGQQSVPISLELDEQHNVLVISGPNAGGKTVAIKTIGLISLMAQMGFHVPAREALLPVFDQIFADIGDQQSIAANLSTFTAHMRNIAEIFQNLGRRALVLIDEVGTGTDPDEGAALAIAIVDGFRRRGAVTIASTHYPRLKVWASEKAGVVNASVEFDERSLRPTFRLLLGIAGASSGLEIARRLNLPPEILAEAAVLIDPDHAQAREYLKRLKESLDEQETLRAALEKERSAVAAKYAGLDAEFNRRERARAEEFESALTRAVDEFKAESERAIRAIKDRAAADRLRKTTQNRAAVLRRETALRSTYQRDFSSGTEAAAASSSAAIAGSNEEIRENDTVRVVSLGREGIVESIKDEAHVVIIGALRYRAERHDLQKVKGNECPAPRKSPGSFPAGSIDAEFIDNDAVSELNVIGLTSEEAIDRVDAFIDRAYLAGLETVRIIHGHGKGILKRAIAGFLAAHPQVARSCLAPPEKGGSGATLVELRK